MIVYFKILVMLSFLIIASYRDIKTRTIPNYIWIRCLGLLLILEAIEVYMYQINIGPYLIGFVFILFLAIILAKLNLWGGADSKFLITIGAGFLVYPTNPVLGTGIGIFAFSVLINSFIPILILPIIFFIKNIKTEGIKNFNLLFFLGYKVRVDKIPDMHSLLQKKTYNGIKYSLRGIEVTDEELFNYNLSDRVWVSPIIPYIVLLTFGFIFAVVFGDITELF